MPFRIAVAPGPVAPALREAITGGGATVAETVEADGSADALVWTDPAGAAALADLLSGAAGVRWVQLPFAGIDSFAHLLGDGRQWTSTKGAYSEAVAEHALGLMLAGLRGFKVRALARSWGPQAGRRLEGAPVTIVGGGGITEALLRLLAPFGVESTVVRRHPDRPVAGAGEVVGVTELHRALASADVVVLALALTPQTRGIIAAPELAAMRPHAWLVNVARGGHVVTDDLVAALRDGAIGGAALDVTDPEPLPAGHPLWDLDNCLITPHTANTWDMAMPLFVERVRTNVARWVAGEPLVGVVDAGLGY